MAAVAERAHTDILSNTPLASDPVSVTMPRCDTFPPDHGWTNLRPLRFDSGIPNCPRPPVIEVVKRLRRENLGLMEMTV